MEKILNQEFGMGKKARIWLLIAVLLFALFSMGILHTLNEKIRSAIREEAERNLININTLNTRAVDRELAGMQNIILSLAESLQDSSVSDLESILQQISVYARNYDIYNMGVLTTEGLMHTISGNVIDVSEKEPYPQALSGEPMVSGTFLALDGTQEQVNIFTAPVFSDGEISFVLVAAYRSQSLAEDLNISVLNGKGYSFILDADGKAMIYPKEGMDEEYLSLLQHIHNSADTLAKEMEKGSAVFTFEGEDYCAYFRELSLNDWYLMTCARSDDVFAGARLIQNSVYAGFAFLWVLLAAVAYLTLALHQRNQEKLQKVAFEDGLLQKKNFEYLRLYFPHMGDEQKQRTALAAFDIDRFKAYNFIYGGKEGNALLRHISRSFQETLPGDQIYRHVADQFVALLNVGSAKEAEEKIRRFQEQLQQDIREKKVFPFSMSFGICMLGECPDLHEAYSDAKIARNTVKNKHLQKYAFYDVQMRQKSMQYLELESAFEDALKNEEFHIYYQPKFDMRTRTVIGSEALVRWFRPDGTMISPGAFIPCFEETGQILRLDIEILRMVCNHILEMEKEGLYVPRVSVNLSRAHLMQPGIIDQIQKMVEELQLDPSHLAFEITESALYDDHFSLQNIVSKLHEMGCKVDMDDYGTGVSSLNSLANIEFDVIKLDKSFIDKIGEPKMETVICSTIELTKKLGMRLIAEGIEEKEQAERLISWGCYYAQGFYYSRPLPKEQYLELLRSQKGRSGSIEYGQPSGSPDKHGL